MLCMWHVHCLSNHLPIWAVSSLAKCDCWWTLPKEHEKDFKAEMHPSVPLMHPYSSVKLHSVEKKSAQKTIFGYLDVYAPCSPQHPIKCPGPPLLYFERAPLVPLHKPQWSENRHQTMAVECSCNPRYSHNDIKPDVCNRKCSCRLFYDAVL